MIKCSNESQRNTQPTFVVCMASTMSAIIYPFKIILINWIIPPSNTCLRFIVIIYLLFLNDPLTTNKFFLANIATLLLIDRNGLIVGSSLFMPLFHSAKLDPIKFNRLLMPTSFIMKLGVSNSLSSWKEMVLRATYIQIT